MPTRRCSQNRPFSLLPGFLLLVLATGLPTPTVLGRPEAVALDQGTEYKLDEGRTWAKTEAPPEPGSDRWIIAQAREHLANDNPEAAEDLLKPWLKANERTSNPSRAEALLLRGDARLAQDREYSALYDYEELIKRHRESEFFPIAVERELDIALRYTSGLRLRLLGFRWADSSDVAVELLIRVQERLPRSQLAEKAAIELADFYYQRRDLRLAYESYDLYLANFPNGPNAIRARERRIQCDVGRFKGPRYNASGLINARTQIASFARRHPEEAETSGMNDALIARLDESMGAQLLDTAQWYLRVNDEASSRFTLKRLIRDFPRTLAAEKGEAMLRERGWLPQDGQEIAPASMPTVPVGDPDQLQPDSSNPFVRESDEGRATDAPGSTPIEPIGTDPREPSQESPR